MNTKFKHWLTKKAFAQHSNGCWFIIDGEYDSDWNWTWTELLEWDE